MVESADSTLKWCSIKLNEVIANGKRLEASVFDVDAKRAWNKIENYKHSYKPLIGADGFVERAHYGNRLKRNYVDEDTFNSIGFLGSSEMLDILPKPVKFMVNDDRVKELRVNHGTILISRSGTIGNCTYVGKTLENYLVSEHAIRLECYKNPGYVYAFLKSKTGHKLIQSRNFGSVIQEIEPDDIAKIPVPNAPNSVQEKINDLIEQSFALRDESNVLLDQAHALLVKELQLPSKKELKKLDKRDNFSVSLSKLNNRLDGSYHLPIVKALTESLEKTADKLVPLSDSSLSKEIILPGRFKRIYVEEGYGRVFIGGKQIYELDPSNKKYLSLARHEDLIKKLELRENMILITCSGTIGKVSMVGSHWNGWTANQHVIRVVPKDESVAGYLYVFLSSEYGYPFITRHIYGSVIDEIDDTQVGEILIPIAKNKDVQDTINGLAITANKKRAEAYNIEQKALSIMEEEILS